MPNATNKAVMELEFLLVSIIDKDWKMLLAFCTCS